MKLITVMSALYIFVILSSACSFENKKTNETMQEDDDELSIDSQVCSHPDGQSPEPLFHSAKNVDSIGGYVAGEPCSDEFFNQQRRDP